MKRKKKILNPGSIDGRPPIDIDWKKIDNLCFIQCTMEEIALVMGVSASTLSYQCKKKFNITFKEYLEQKRAGGKASLRRSQWLLAVGRESVYDDQGNLIQSELKPNPTMAIFLGKNYLNQRDVWEQHTFNENNYPESTEAFKELDDLCKKYGIKITTNGKANTRNSKDDNDGDIQGRVSEKSHSMDSGSPENS